MKTRRRYFRTVAKIVLAIFAALVGVVGISAAVVFWHITPSVHEFPVAPDVQLTEEVAIEYTRKALVLDRKGSPGMHPFKWTDREFDYFARNTLDPNRGKVLWETDSDRRGWDFAVRIEKTDSKITCSIYRSI